MSLPETMYDYRPENKVAEHQCQFCNDPISDDEFESHGECCDFCRRHEVLSEECEECGQAITQADYYSNDYMCDDCYDDANY